MMKMMEAKVFAALCALLIINFGSADDAAEGGYVTASTPTGSNGSFVELHPVPTAGSTGHVVTSDHLNESDTGPNPGNTSSLSNATIAEEKKNGSVMATPAEDSGSNIVNPSVMAAPESNVTQPSPPSPPAASNTSTTGVPLNSSSTASPNQPDHSDRPNVTVTAAPSANTSADSGNHTKANSSAEVTSSEPPKVEPTTAAAATSASTTVSPVSSPAATASTTATTNSSTTQIPAAKSASPTPSHSTSQTVGPHQGQTTAQPSSTTTQGKGHAASPSQLNVNGEDAKKIPDSPTLDPLLAALVSAFIIAAVIIILLLFLKLRKRGNQPEFRRLQDLPMDDMMEDTPLSMYSY